MFFKIYNKRKSGIFLTQLPENPSALPDPQTTCRAISSNSPFASRFNRGPWRIGRDFSAARQLSRVRDGAAERAARRNQALCARPGVSAARRRGGNSPRNGGQCVSSLGARLYTPAGSPTCPSSGLSSFLPRALAGSQGCAALSPRDSRESRRRPLPRTRPFN